MYQMLALAISMAMGLFLVTTGALVNVIPARAMHRAIPATSTPSAMSQVLKRQVCVGQDELSSINKNASSPTGALKAYLNSTITRTTKVDALYRIARPITPNLTLKFPVFTSQASRFRVSMSESIMAKASMCAAAFPNNKGTVEPLPSCLKGAAAAKGASEASSRDLAVAASMIAMFMSLFAIAAAVLLV